MLHSETWSRKHEGETESGCAKGMQEGIETQSERMVSVSWPCLGGPGTSVGEVALGLKWMVQAPYRLGVVWTCRREMVAGCSVRVRAKALSVRLACAQHVALWQCSGPVTAHRSKSIHFGIVLV
jgi:hypothetical protein